LTAHPQEVPLHLTFRVQPLDAVPVGPSLLARFPVPALGTAVGPQARSLTVSSKPLAAGYLRRAQEALSHNHGALAAALARSAIESDATVWPPHRLLIEAAARTGTLLDERAHYESAEGLEPWIRCSALGLCDLRAGQAS